MAFLTDEEFGLLHSCVGQHREPLIEFLVAKGARVGEAAALTPRDIDMAEDTVRIPAGPALFDRESFQLGPPNTKDGIRTIDAAADTWPRPI
jgi:integrase